MKIDESFETVYIVGFKRIELRKYKRKAMYFRRI